MFDGFTLIPLIVLVGIPIWLVYRKVGLEPLWLALMLLPGLGFVILLVMAASRAWPRFGERPNPDFFADAWNVVLVLLGLLIPLIPMFIVLKRAGYSGWWCLLALIPVVNVIALWVFALATWPAEGPSTTYY